MSSPQEIRVGSNIKGIHRVPPAAAKSLPQTTDTNKFKAEYNKMPEKFRPIMPLLEVFYITPPISAAEASKFAFEAAFSTVFGQNCTNGKTCHPKQSPFDYTDHHTRSKWYSFSDTWHFGTGTMIVMNSFSNLQTSISGDYLQLKNGACADSITNSNYDQLERTAWGRLNELYYQVSDPASP